MPHIHTAPNQHDTTVTAFIVRIDEDEPKLLLHMHRKFGILMPPGGHIELDETPWAAMSHELEEESGYVLSELDLLQPKVRLEAASRIVIHPQPFLSNTHAVSDEHFHTDLDYLLIAHDAPSRLPHEGESNDLRWLSASEIAALPDDLILMNIREICAFIFDELLNSPDHERVPATNFSLEKFKKAE